jgi:Uma2 family endonuclease
LRVQFKQELSVASTPTRLMTFGEFEQLPTPNDGRLELRHGQAVKIAPLIFGHFLIQQMLRDLLDRAAAGRGRAYTQLGFRGLTGGEYWIARVAYVSEERWTQQDPNGYFEGAPDLVIEVISPANTMAEMLDKRILCLENGAREFWLVDAGHRQVEVSTPDGHAITYKSGQEIPLFFGGRIPVDAIFSGRT